MFRLCCQARDEVSDDGDLRFHDAQVADALAWHDDVAMMANSLRRGAT